MKEKVRLKDIANAVGVSIVTVSNALSGKKGVGKELRGKIVNQAKEMGMDLTTYRIKSAENAMIGVLISENLVSIGSSFYWELYQNAATAASEQHSFTTLELLGKEQIRNMTVPQVVSGGKVDALIIIGKIGEEYLKTILATAGVPIVLLDFYDAQYNCDAVLSCNYFGMYKSTCYLINHGHKDIGFIGSMDNSNNIRERYLGYRKAMEEYGFSINQDWVLYNRDSVTEAQKIVLPKTLPTAFACSSDYAAGRLYSNLKAHGLKVPEDISITGYDNYLYGNSFADDLTTYNVDMKAMGDNAVRLIQYRLQYGFDKPKAIFVDSYVVERQSVKSLFRNQ